MERGVEWQNRLPVQAHLSHHWLGWTTLPAELEQKLSVLTEEKRVSIYPLLSYRS